ncbi:Phospholipase/Carboxylesterase [Flavobacteriaceae bacterium MAR_2010_188]|nr:Phospholipase/Carboxylesterase [Flavobacteriaceae bacterium MAR_2010_188]
MKIIKILLFAFLFSAINLSFGQNDNLYQKEIFIKNGDSLRYRIMYPEDFSKDKVYPMVLFLHGAGERGNDNESQLIHGSELFASLEARDSFPAIVIFPQCPNEGYWANVKVDRTTHPLTIEFPEDKPATKSMSLVMSLVKEYQKENYINSERIYLGGLSMGGMGTFEILERMPDTFASAFAICGGDNVDAISAYSDKTPLWIFHGAKDDVVDPQLSVDIVGELLKLGANPNFNLYANDNHNSWDSAFAEPGLLKWLFSKSKSE